MPIYQILCMLLIANCITQVMARIDANSASDQRGFGADDSELIAQFDNMAAPTWLESLEHQALSLFGYSQPQIQMM